MSLPTIVTAPITHDKSNKGKTANPSPMCKKYITIKILFFHNRFKYFQQSCYILVEYYSEIYTFYQFKII